MQLETWAKPEGGEGLQMAGGQGLGESRVWQAPIKHPMHVHWLGGVAWWTPSWGRLGARWLAEGSVREARGWGGGSGDVNNQCI